VLAPSFAVSYEDIKHKIKGNVNISARSTLVLEGNVMLEDLDLDGTLFVKAEPGAQAVLKGLKVTNAGSDLVSSEDPLKHPPFMRIRGYELDLKDCERLVVDSGVKTFP